MATYTAIYGIVEAAIALSFLSLDRSIGGKGFLAKYSFVEDKAGDCTPQSFQVIKRWPLAVLHPEQLGHRWC